MNVIYIVSASDRFNFGDLLFNYILEYYLEKGSRSTQMVSLFGNDLTMRGGHVTKSLKSMLKIINDGDVVVIAGGGVLGHKWAPMYFQTNGGFIWRVLKRFFKPNLIEKVISRLFFNKMGAFPYTIDKNLLPHNSKIIYNSVGGGALEVMGRSERGIICNILEKADFVSVRDDFVSSKVVDIEHYVFPDSAILISEIIHEDYTILEDVFKRARISIPEEYIILHFNPMIARKYFHEINNLIIDLKNKQKGCEIVLMPVNYEINSYDIDGLNLFKENASCIIFDINLTVKEICSLVAFSKLVLSSSLHVNVVSCSYGVQHLGLTKDVRKLNNFFQTWYGGSEFYQSYDIIDLINIIDHKEGYKEELVSVSDKLKNKAIQNIKSINKTINSNNG